MKYYILSDIHLDDTEKDFFKEKRLEILRQNIKKIINDKETKKVFLNGDTFNKDTIRVNSYSAKIFIEEIATPLLKKGIELNILLWNHERSGTWDTFRFLKGEIANPLIKIRDKIENIEFDDFNAIFIPFMMKGDKDVSTVSKLQEIVETEIKELVNKVKNENKNKKLIIFNHNMMSDLPFDIGKEINIKFWQIPWVDMVFSWHIHKFEEFKVNKEVKGLYIGSLMKSFVYEEESEWFLGFDIKNSKIEYKFFENKSFNYEKIEIEDLKEFNESMVKPNTVYDITFIVKSDNVDEYFIQNVLSIIKSKNSYIKKYLTKNEWNEALFKNGVTLITSIDTILAEYLKDNKIKDKQVKEEYFNKLEKCKAAISNNWLDKLKESKEEKEELLNLKKINTLSSQINNKYSL